MSNPPEILPDKLYDGDWRVETIHDETVSVVIFSGPLAELEARRYHDWLSGAYVAPPKPPRPPRGKVKLSVVKRDSGSAPAPRAGEGE